MFSNNKFSLPKTGCLWLRIPHVNIIIFWSVNKINNIKQTIQGNLPKIYLLHGELTDSQMNQMYNHPKVKAHISLTHGEGFGRPLLEATQSGKPVIASAWSGQVDFLNKRKL